MNYGNILKAYLGVNLENYYTTGKLVIFTSANSYTFDEGTTAGYSTICNRVDNWQSRNLGEVVYGFIYKPYMSGNPYLSLSTACDFFAIHTYQWVYLTAFTYTNNVISQPYDYFNIGLKDSLNYFNDMAYTPDNFYGVQYKSELSVGKNALYDYNFVSGLDYVKGSYTSFYNKVVEFDSDGSEYDFDLYVGSNTAEIRQSAYTEGKADGYTEGYTAGEHVGYSNGFTAGQVGGTEETAHAFTYISQAFGVVADIMSVEVLPHITLGTCFSIPLVIVLIMTIFKLVRK